VRNPSTLVASGVAIIVFYFAAPMFVAVPLMECSLVDYMTLDRYFLPPIKFAADHVPFYRQFIEWQLGVMGIGP
jgi:hypothetical protein